jgi:ribonuclease HI
MADKYRDSEFPRLFSPENIGLEEASPWQLFKEDSEGTLLHLFSSSRVIGVYIDGACPGNGTPRAKGGYGVYFGSDSQFNVSKPLKENSPQTSQRAELTAALVALNQIERIVKIARDNGTNLNPFIIMTDSAYLVNSLTSYIYKWQNNDYTAATGRQVANRDLFERVDDKLDAMANGRQGIDVLFWKVDRSDNEDADGLAREGADM